MQRIPVSACRIYSLKLLRQHTGMGKASDYGELILIRA